jgi:ubiquinone/menaquinone biosynthesis C-methylase UbiE
MKLKFLTHIIVIGLLFTANLRSAEQYGPASKEYAAGRQPHPEKVFAILKNYIKPDSQILDLASGTGIATRGLCQHGFKNVIGIDFDPHMLAQAQAANTSECQIKYLQGDVHKGLPLANEQFDVVTTFSAFHWYASPAALKEIARVLKPDGYFIVVTKTVIEDPIKTQVKQIVAKFSNNSGNQHNVDTVKELKEAQFKILNETSLAFVNYYTREGYINYAVKGSSRWNAIRNTPQAAEALKEVNQYLDTVADKDGKIKEHREVKVIVSQKP